MKLLVVGAQGGSLGAAVKELAQESAFGWEVYTAGISGQEDEKVNLAHSPQRDLEALVRAVRPDHIVCTVGVNQPRRAYSGTDDWYQDHFAANVIGPMRLLDAWLAYGPDGDVPWQHFVGISSNSAGIPRSSSAAYCASKAALSMALRVRARDCAGANLSVSVYGYEPGLLAGTPMTAEAAERFNGPLTRMKGAAVEHGLSVYGVAGHIVRNIAFGGPELNGVLLRLDAGEV